MRPFSVTLSAAASLAMADLVHGNPADDSLDLLDLHDLAARANTPSTLLTAPPTATPSTHANAVSAAPSTIPTHTIAVGATGFTFSPNNLSGIAVGSVIEFNFYPGNHSVVRSAFEFPCIPYENTGPNRVGFFSGFLDTNVYSSDGPKYRVRVNDTDPIFYYCAAPGSCIAHGMIGVINPVRSYSLFLLSLSLSLSLSLWLPSLTVPERYVDARHPARVRGQHDHPADARRSAAVRDGADHCGWWQWSDCIYFCLCHPRSQLFFVVIIVVGGCHLSRSHCWHRARRARRRCRPCRPRCSALWLPAPQPALAGPTAPPPPDAASRRQNDRRSRARPVVDALAAVVLITGG